MYGTLWPCLASLQPLEHNMNAWKVYKPWGGDTVSGRLYYVDTVFYTSDCDAEYVRNSLINHDGFPATIVVVKDSK